MPHRVRCQSHGTVACRAAVAVALAVAAAMATAGIRLGAAALGPDAAPAFLRQVATLENPRIGYNFGHAVAIDGDTLAIGAPMLPDVGTYRGGVAIYTRTGGTWTLQQTLSRPDGFGFGGHLALSGETLVVSRLNINQTAAGVYVYVRSGTSWSLQATLRRDDNSGEHAADVAIDGDTVLLGYGDGRAYVFERVGTAWTQQARLPLTDGADRDMDIALQGDTAVVGRPRETVDGRALSGAAYVFVRSNGVWSEQARLIPRVRGTNGFFGHSLGLSGDSLLVGSRLGYVFTREGATWTEQALLELPPPPFPGVPLDVAGVTGDGDSAILQITVAEGYLPRTAHVYKRIAGSWVRVDPAIGQALLTLAISGDTVVNGFPTYGAYVGESSYNAPGIAYVLTMPDATPPGTPRNLRGAVSGSTVALTWETPAGGAPADHTLLGRGTLGGPLIGTAPIGAEPAFGIALPNGTYVLSVRASNAFGTSPESNAFTVTVPQAAPPPGAPSALTSQVSGSTVGFSWRAPASGGAVDNYVLVAGLTPAFAVPFATLSLGADTTHAVSGVPAGTYFVRVLAQNASGLSAPSNEVMVSVAGLSAPGAPTLNPAIVSGATVSLSWTAGPGGPPTGYTLTASTTPGGVPVATVPMTGTSASFTNVPRGEYYVVLTASNAAGTSPPSAPLMVTVR